MNIEPEVGTSRVLTVTVTESAGMLGISRSAAYALVGTGGLPSVRLGRRIVVPVRALAGMLGLSLNELQATLAVPALESAGPGHEGHAAVIPDTVSAGPRTREPLRHEQLPHGTTQGSPLRR